MILEIGILFGVLLIWLTLGYFLWAKPYKNKTSKSDFQETEFVIRLFGFHLIMDLILNNNK